MKFSLVYIILSTKLANSCLFVVKKIGMCIAKHPLGFTFAPFFNSKRTISYRSDLTAMYKGVSQNSEKLSTSAPDEINSEKYLCYHPEQPQERRTLLNCGVLNHTKETVYVLKLTFCSMHIERTRNTRRLQCST